mmetsp:Transcript_25900/g.58075  ORF Transcript_25900/g.58075 Transcript_25900/m.58075 type:complete len:273 (-) Transcript_25900:526-1344(-)
MLKYANCVTARIFRLDVHSLSLLCHHVAAVTDRDRDRRLPLPLGRRGAPRQLTVDLVVRLAAPRRRRRGLPPPPAPSRAGRRHDLRPRPAGGRDDRGRRASPPGVRGGESRASPVADPGDAGGARAHEERVGDRVREEAEVTAGREEARRVEVRRQRRLDLRGSHARGLPVAGHVVAGSEEALVPRRPAVLVPLVRAEAELAPAPVLVVDGFRRRGLDGDVGYRDGAEGARRLGLGGHAVERVLDDLQRVPVDFVGLPGGSGALLLPVGRLG